MSEKIRMTLDPDSIAKAAKQLRDYAKKLKASTLWIDQRLNQVAADEARTHFDGDVTVIPQDHSVVAMGPGVVFQEFGAGSRISDPYPGGASVDFDIRRGAYSDLHQGEYAQSGYEMWHYNGEEYRYVTPTNALFHGMMKAREEAAQIIREELEAKHD